MTCQQGDVYKRQHMISTQYQGLMNKAARKGGRM